jgi:hypothetical protein
LILNQDFPVTQRKQFKHDGKRFVARSAPRPAASLALRAVGVALPPTIRAAGETAAH